MFESTSVLVVSALASCFIFSAVCVALCVYLHKSQRATEKALQKQITMMKTGVQSMGTRVLELENRLSNLRESQNELSHSTQDYAYTQARNLLNTGMSEDAIAETSGLSASEIRLMKLVHAGVAQPAPAMA